MSACIRCNEPAAICARHAELAVVKLRAEVADLKARLKEVKRQCIDRPEMYAEAVYDVADLRRRNWRKP